MSEHTQHGDLLMRALLNIYYNNILSKKRIICLSNKVKVLLQTMKDILQRKTRVTRILRGKKHLTIQMFT